MSALHGAIIGHVVKRGISAAHEHFNNASPEYIARLQHDAELYDQAGPQGEISPQQMLPILITGFVTLLIIASVRRNDSLCMMHGLLTEPRYATLSATSWLLWP